VKARLRRWGTESTRALNRAVVPPLVARRFGVGNVDPAMLRHVAVFPGLGIAFNRIKKNANSTSVMLLHLLESGVHADEKIAKRDSLHLEKMPWACWPSIASWFFVVVVRDPYSRVLSAFINKFAKERYVDAYRSYEISRKGFGEFVHWLADGGIEADAHWDLQRKLMLLPLDRYDAVIRFESYAVQMRSLLVRRGVEPTPDIDALIGTNRGRHPSSANEKLASFYTPELFALVRELYREDFETLGYPLEPAIS
jgi:Sulfotransferase family